MYYVIFELVFAFKAYVIDFLENINFHCQLLPFDGRILVIYLNYLIQQFCSKVIICHFKVTKVHVYFLNLFNFTSKLKRISLNIDNWPLKFLK
jgi:hypothetical protein